PIEWPFARRSSRLRACASAWSRSRWANALISPSSAAMRSRQARVYSSAEIAPRAISAAASLAVSLTSSSPIAPLPALASSAVEVVGEPKRHPGPQIHDHHTNHDDDHIGHHAAEDLIEGDVRR